MSVKYFILGVIVGVVGSAVVLAAALAVLGTRPLPAQPQPASPPTGDVTLSIQEGYLGRVATELAREQEPMIQTVVVDVQPGGRVDMTLGLQLTVLGRTLDLQARLVSAVRVADARLWFDLQKIEFAGIDIPLDLLPQSLRTTMETTVADANAQANRMLVDTGLVPLGVTTDDASIAVSLRAR